jgi:hypothetical protein
MKRLLENEVVGLSVGETAVDCRVAALTGGEASLHALRPAEAKLLPPASAGATLVFTHRGGLVMLRGAMYRGGSIDDLRFAEGSRSTTAVAEQRRRAARVEIGLLASVTALAADGTPEGEEHQLITRDLSLGGLALDIGRAPLLNGTRLRFTVTLPDLTQVGGTGRVVRAAGSMCGVKFEDVAPADRLKLAGFLVARQGARPAAEPR